MGLRQPSPLNSVALPQSNDADGMANSVDPDQTAPLGRSLCPKNFESLRYK